MADDEWCRNRAWTPEARAESEKRLARAHGRQQHLFMKAKAIHPTSHVKAARTLASVGTAFVPEPHRRRRSS